MKQHAAPTHGIFGVVHLPALPGDPQEGPGTYAAVRDFALRDAEALARGGVDAIVVENFGSAPFAKGVGARRIPPHQAAAIAVVCADLGAAVDIPIGVNCLRNDARSALGIAAATSSAFVRVNVHIGAYVTDQGLIEGEADETLRYRAALGAPVALWADVLVKHASPLAPTTPAQAVGDTLHRGLADAVIVTGTGTGRPVGEPLLKEVRDAAGDAAVFLGSGLTMANTPILAPLADGAIVGTAFKQDGNVRAPVDEERVRALCELAKAHLRPPA